MITGLFLSNYKCYENSHFIPFGEYGNGSLNIFIGDNGVGKSTILESLDCILNNIEPKKWETSLGKKKVRTSIFPIFIIDKKNFKQDKRLEAISNIFWNADLTSISNHETSKKFHDYREKLKESYSPENYYLFSIGKNGEGSLLLTTLYHNKITASTKVAGVSRAYISELFKDVIKKYTYLYFPVENKVDDYLTLQAREMQALMESSTIDEIKRVLDKKDIIKGGTNRSISIMDLINYRLESHLNDVNRKISSEYEFIANTHKKNIKSTDIIDIAIEQYFKVRELTKDKKKLKNLSSGQKRLALIDVATTMLQNIKARKTEVIVAIDEPESSLDNQHRLEQFSKLTNLSEKYKHQVFMTTHWYGLLLRPVNGTLYFVGENNQSSEKISHYPMVNLYDYRRKFPNSLEMKSYFDLMSSMLSIIKNKNINWLVCEGYTDAIYLNHYIKKKENLIILPFNGNGNIKKLFEFLSVPFSDENEQEFIKGKVFCLIDTDAKNFIKIDGYNSSKYGKKLHFHRLARKSHDNKIHILPVSSTCAYNTNIEDALNPSIFYKTLLEISKKNPLLSRLLSNYELNKDAEYTLISSDLHFLKKKTIEGYEKQNELISLINSKEMKSEIANIYCSISKNEAPHNLEWVKSIEETLSE